MAPVTRYLKNNEFSRNPYEKQCFKNEKIGEASDFYQTETKLIISFKSLRVNCCKINQIIKNAKWIFWKTCKNGPKQKSDHHHHHHHHRILHAPNSLGIKFQHKLKILSFWTKLIQSNLPNKSLSNLKRKTRWITIKFYIFQLV